MIEYYEQLSEEEQDDIKHVIQTLYRQTFLLERKFEKRTGRMVPVREYWRHFVTQKLLYISSMLLSIAFFIIFLIVDIVYEYCRIASSIFVFTMSAISGVFNCLYSS